MRSLRNSRRCGCTAWPAPEPICRDWGRTPGWMPRSGSSSICCRPSRKIAPCAQCVIRSSRPASRCTAIWRGLTSMPQGSIASWWGITQHGKRVRFYSTVDLVNALEQEKAQGKAEPVWNFVFEA